MSKIVRVSDLYPNPVEEKKSLEKEIDKLEETIDEKEDRLEKVDYEIERAEALAKQTVKEVEEKKEKKVTRRAGAVKKDA